MKNLCDLLDEIGGMPEEKQNYSFSDKDAITRKYAYNKCRSDFREWLGEIEIDKELKKNLEWVKTFVEYARYELNPGESEIGSQFPHQADADKAIRILSAALSSAQIFKRTVKKDNQ